MSDQARSYTIDHSPYSGSGYLIHYMMATIANPTHDWRLFVGDTKLAQMCRVSVRTLQRQKAQMIEDGFLEELPVTSAPGRVKEYRFLMPTGDNLASVTGDNLASVDLERATPSAVTGDTQRGNGRQMAQSDLSIEPRNQENQEEPLPQAATATVITLDGKTVEPAKPTRKRDALFDALVEVCKIVPGELTQGARGSANKALKDLREVGATAEDIRTRGERFRQLWPHMTLTPAALAKQWATVGGAPMTATRTNGTGQPNRDPSFMIRKVSEKYAEG